VGTYDKPGQLPWALPLKIMVSADGKEWTEITRIPPLQRFTES